MGRANDGGRAAKLAAKGGALAALGWIGYSALAVPHNLELPHAVSGERQELSGRSGRLSYYVAGEGAPLLLIHSINAAGSAYEVRTLFEHYRASRRVYAVDLPGFGFSDRSPRDYSVRLYVDAVHDMVDLIAREHGPGPLDALALSLASEFLARAAAERQDAFRSLALVTPTGFGPGSSLLVAPEGSTREVPGMRQLIGFPLWGRALFDALASKGSIRFFLERTWGSKHIDEGMLHYDYLTTHQPGAENAPFAFLSGKLFSNDIRTVYDRLAIPVWMPHGTKGDFGNFSEAGWAEARPNWTVTSYPTGALPHFEVPAQFFADYDRFLAAPVPAGRPASVA